MFKAFSWKPNLLRVVYRRLFVVAYRNSAPDLAGFFLRRSGTKARQSRLNAEPRSTKLFSLIALPVKDEMLMVVAAGDVHQEESHRSDTANGGEKDLEP